MTNGYAAPMPGRQVPPKLVERWAPRMQQLADQLLRHADRSPKLTMVPPRRGGRPRLKVQLATEAGGIPESLVPLIAKVVQRLPLGWRVRMFDEHYEPSDKIMTISRWASEHDIACVMEDTFHPVAPLPPLEKLPPHAALETKPWYRQVPGWAEDHLVLAFAAIDPMTAGLKPLGDERHE